MWRTVDIIAVFLMGAVTIAALTMVVLDWYQGRLTIEEDVQDLEECREEPDSL